MELFIPSLLVLVIISLFVFLIIPRMSIPVILFFSAAILIYVLQNHYKLFYSEYRYSTWQYNLQQYAPYVIILVLIFFVFTSIGITTYSGYSTPTTMPEVQALPSAASATNSITSAINNGMKAVSSVATSVTNKVTNAVNNLSRKNTKNNTSSTYDLTSLLTGKKTNQ